MEMDIDDYFLERSLGFIDDEQAVHNPVGEDFFQWYQRQLRRRNRWRQVAAWVHIAVEHA